MYSSAWGPNPGHWTHQVTYCLLFLRIIAYCWFLRIFPLFLINRSLSEVFFCKYFHSARGFSFRSHGMVFSRAEDLCLPFHLMKGRKLSGLFDWITFQLFLRSHDAPIPPPNHRWSLIFLLLWWRGRDGRNSKLLITSVPEFGRESSECMWRTQTVQISPQEIVPSAGSRSSYFSELNQDSQDNSP